MFIRVTSWHSGHSGMPIYVNVDHISSIHVHEAADGTMDGTILYLFGGKSSVYAEENIEDIYNQIEICKCKNIHVREKNT